MSEFDVHQVFLKIHDLMKNPQAADGLAEKLKNAYAVGDEQKEKLVEAQNTIAQAAHIMEEMEASKSCLMTEPLKIARCSNIYRAKSRSSKAR